MPRRYIKKITGISESTCSEYNRMLMEAIQLEHINQPYKPTGGPGIVVEIDKSKFGKQKYNVRNNQWKIIKLRILTDFVLLDIML